MERITVILFLLGLKGALHESSYVDLLCSACSQECWVDEEGKYMEEAGPGLSGLPVLDEGNNTILKLLSRSCLCFLSHGVGLSTL